jgi:hypothetical protein
VVVCSYVHTNAGLCGPLVSVGSVGTSYTNGIGGTNLGNDCPTSAPTSAPTAPTSAPTSAPTVGLPCCEDLRLNLIFCCMEARHPELAQSVCRECGTGK